MVHAKVHTSRCRHCGAVIYFGVVIAGEWVHPLGNVHCLDANGFTATPIRRAEPVLETEVL